jgi:hypothetical protein
MTDNIIGATVNAQVNVDFADIIKNAMQSSFGILALICLIVGILALGLFYKAADHIKLGIFGLVFLSAVAFGAAVIVQSEKIEVVDTIYPSATEIAPEVMNDADSVKRPNSSSYTVPDPTVTPLPEPVVTQSSADSANPPRPLPNGDTSPIAIKPTIDRPNYRVVLNQCPRRSFGIECELTITAKSKTQVRYSRHTYLAEKGGHRIPVSWISIGGDGQDAPRHIGDYRYLEPGQSTDIAFRFYGDIKEMESLSASFDSFGVKSDTFMVAPDR